MARTKSGLRLAGFLLIVTGLAACAEPSSQPFRAPVISNPTPVTIALTPTFTLQTSIPPAVTPTPQCSDNLEFITDLTYPDGTVVRPGETLDKRWQVRNSGTCNWTDGYVLRFASGQTLGGGDNQPMYPARGGTEAIIRMVFTAPAEDGQYRSAWQAYNPAGEAFGDPFFIEIIVQTP